jgi:hypothetical protein
MRPVVRLKGRMVQVREVAAGAAVGYGLFMICSRAPALGKVLSRQESDVSFVGTQPVSHARAWSRITA